MKTHNITKEIAVPQVDEIEQVQAAFDQMVDDVNRAIGELRRDVHTDISRGLSVHQQRQTSVSALNSDVGVLSFRLSGTKHHLVTRLSTVIYATVLSTSGTGPA